MLLKICYNINKGKVIIIFLEITDNNLDYIKLKDHKLAKYINKYGVLKISLTKDIYVSIVMSIIGQMLSAKASQTIKKRFINTVGEVNPTNVISITDDTLRACGISYSKIRYIKELSVRILNGDMNLNLLKCLSDEDVIIELMKIKGVGRWTAEMVAIFSLGRLNIFSYDDVALKNGIMKIHGLESINKSDFEKFRKLYEPYCSIASIYYYHFIDNEKSI
jgi:DNA-3-methyladenine glycosylase II